MKISDEVIKILEYLCTKIGVTIDWTNENVLPYVGELCEKFIKWETNTSYAWIAIAGVAIVIGLVFAILIHCLDGWDGIEWFIFGMIVLLSMITISVQVFDIIECQTFPEKAIYDYIQMHINNG